MHTHAAAGADTQIAAGGGGVVSRRRRGHIAAGLNIKILANQRHIALFIHLKKLAEHRIHRALARIQRRHMVGVLASHHHQMIAAARHRYCGHGAALRRVAAVAVVLHPLHPVAGFFVEQIQLHQLQARILHQLHNAARHHQAHFLQGAHVVLPFVDGLRLRGAFGFGGSSANWS